MKSQPNFVEIKTVTWSKDSHGLFDYESKNVQFNKTKVETSSEIYKSGNEVVLRSLSEPSAQKDDSVMNAQNYLFSVETASGKAGKYLLKSGIKQNLDENPQNNPFLIVRSLKNEDGTQKGYDLQLGDVIRFGRIEYRVLEFQDHNSKISSVLNNEDVRNSCPFNLAIKDCNGTSTEVKQCKICLMDEHDSTEALVNPCSCKGTSEYVHIKCLQDWISSKVKKKVNPTASCIYWKKLNCEICKVSLPDLVDVGGQKQELVPIHRTESPYLLLERVFYDKSKESTSNSKTMILLSITNDSNHIKMGRGHDCDLRENDISVSRLHAFIKYNEGKFTVVDNNSKFGTLILLRKDYEIERKKIAIQSGRTVITFSLKQAVPNDITASKDVASASKMKKVQSPESIQGDLSPSPTYSSPDKFGLGLNLIKKSRADEC